MHNIITYLTNLFGWLPLISKEQAAEIAACECKSRGWAFYGPIEVVRDCLSRNYLVRSGVMRTGGAKAWLKIDVMTGEVKGAGYIPR